MERTFTMRRARLANERTRDIALELGATLGAPLVVTIALGALMAARRNAAYGDLSLGIVLRAVVEVIQRREVLEAISATLYLTARGLVMGGFGAGIVISVAGLAPRFAPQWLSFLNSLRAIPLTLLIPFLAALPLIPGFLRPPWLSGDMPGRDPAYIIALGSFLYLVVGGSEGINLRDRTREGILRLQVGFTRREYLRNVLVYEMAPALIASLRIAILFAFVLAIVLEQLMSYPGIGREIMQRAASSTAGSNSFAESIGLLFWVGLLGAFIDFGFRNLRRKTAPWLESSPH